MKRVFLALIPVALLATASLAIGRYIADLAQKTFGL